MQWFHLFKQNMSCLVRSFNSEKDNGCTSDKCILEMRKHSMGYEVRDRRWAILISATLLFVLPFPLHRYDFTPSKAFLYQYQKLSSRLIQLSPEQQPTLVSTFIDEDILFPWCNWTCSSIPFRCLEFLQWFIFLRIRYDVYSYFSITFSLISVSPKLCVDQS